MQGQLLGPLQMTGQRYLCALTNRVHDLQLQDKKIEDLLWNAVRCNALKSA